MVTVHNLGFPRIGVKRELKFALEAYWQGNISSGELEQTAQNLRQCHWQNQSKLDLVPVGDFSYYDHVLDTSFLFGNIPSRIQQQQGEKLDHYFQVARGRSGGKNSCLCHVAAGEMTKWFDTNYHYIVPEFTKDTRFVLNSQILLDQLKEAKKKGLKTKIVLLGPVTYLWLGKEQDKSDKLALLPALLEQYQALLQELAEQGESWVQLDEPILVTELAEEWKKALVSAYKVLKQAPIYILLATYFGKLKENIALLPELGVQGFHIDAINARDEIPAIIKQLKDKQVLSLGVVNGRNIWKTDLNATLEWLEPIYAILKKRLWLAPSCSLLHVPVDLERESKMDAEIRSWLSFAIQKLDEITVLAKALNEGREAVKEALSSNQACLDNRRQSNRVHNDQIKKLCQSITSELGNRKGAYADRMELQQKILNLPLLPTTTIGSFPQTQNIRQIRSQFRKGELSLNDYGNHMKEAIAYCVEQQESLGLDVLVHGEPERNDMVEYFGELLQGYVFSQQGWVQSYGSRCVKPPIIFGDISRPEPMTVEWITYAQSLTAQPMKGMLTGPVTMLNWSFVRDDQPRSETCYQLAMAIRQEVLDLEKAGIRIIQIDEAALREGLPLRRSEWQRYLDWAIRSFRITANGVKDQTQIHTHMCYSEFNDIIAAIAQMDADVITIETSRSHMELLKAFEEFEYPNSIGPGVYDIHSPNIPTVESIVHLIHQAEKYIPVQRLWINPDCGLKTRQWSEVIPSLKNMVQAAQILREEYKKKHIN